MTDTDARERWQATLQALNARKPYTKHGATPLQHVAAMRRDDVDPDTGITILAVPADGNGAVNAMMAVAASFNAEVARRRWLAMYVEHLLDVAGAAADEAQRRYDQACVNDPVEITAQEQGFAAGARFVLEALLHSMETDPSGARPTVNRIETAGAVNVPREARSE